MEKFEAEGLDKTKINVETIGKLFPNCVTEVMNKEGKSEFKIDFDKLKEELCEDVIGKDTERYQFTWPEKRSAIHNANSRTDNVLRPVVSRSLNFDDTKNLYIEGDNLEVLKVLRENYLGQVKMIYIDPPYNTGKDFVYNDNFTMEDDSFALANGSKDLEGNRLLVNMESSGRFHTKWLNMMYSRLKVARDVLTDDGVIFISIDDHEVENLKKLCNEIFGERNFVGQWNWFKSATPPNLSKKIKKNIEYIIAFQKGANTDIFSGVKKTSSSNDPITKPQNTVKDLKFKAGSIITKLPDGIIPAGVYGTAKFPNELLNDLEIKNGTNVNEVSFKNKFIWVQETLNEQIAKGTKIELSKQLVISYKKADYSPEVPPNLIDKEVGVDTTENAGNDLAALFDGQKVFDYPKPVSLIKYLVNFFIKGDEEALIMDFFSGSASTAEAVMELNLEDEGNRKFILVQVDEKTGEDSVAFKAGYKSICEIGEERIRRVANRIQAQSKTVDTGFRVLCLDSSNMADIYFTPQETNPTLFKDDIIKSDRTSFDLLFQVMSKCDIKYSEQIRKEVINGKEIYFVKNNYLAASFDSDLTDDIIKEIAKRKPYHFVMGNKSAAEDSVLDNFEQIFKTYSPYTKCEVM